MIVTEAITGHARAALLEEPLDGEQRRLDVERVEDGLDEQQVDAAVDQAAGLLVVGRHELVEGDARARRGRSRRATATRVRFVGPERAGHEARRARAPRAMTPSAARAGARARPRR